MNNKGENNFISTNENLTIENSIKLIYNIQYLKKYSIYKEKFDIFQLENLQKKNEYI